MPWKTPGTCGVNDVAAVCVGSDVDNGNGGSQDAVSFPRPAALDAIKQHEGFENFLYLDSVGLITIGYGWNLEAGGHSDTAPKAAAGLPFIDRTTKLPPADMAKAVQLAWDALRKISKDGTYNFVNSKGKASIHGASWYVDKTPLYIDTSTSNNPLQKHFDEDVARFTANLENIFDNFETFPIPAREALLDMVFNMGPGRKAVAAQTADAAHHIKGHQARKGTGLQGFSHLLADIVRRDWEAAAKDSNRPQVNIDRNKWTRSLFIEAISWESAKTK